MSVVSFFSPLRPMIFEKGPEALRSSRQLFIYQRRGSWIRWVWDEHGQSQYVSMSVSRPVVRLHNRFLQVCACGTVCVYIYVCVRAFGVYVRTMSTKCCILECVVYVCACVLVCFVCICLQSGRSQILHIYMIQLACSIKIIYNCYNI